MVVCHVGVTVTRTGGKQQEPFKMDYNNANLFIASTVVATVGKYSGAKISHQNLNLIVIISIWFLKQHLRVGAS